MGNHGKLNIHSFLVQWLLHSFGLLMLGLLIGGMLSFEHGRIRQREQAHLFHQAALIENILEKKFDALNLVLGGLRGQAARTSSPAGVNHLLQLFGETLAGVTSLNILDTQGIIRASNQPDLIGTDCRQSIAFGEIRQHPDPHLLFLGSPFLSPSGTRAMTVSHRITQADGAFAGIVSALLEARFFLPLLEAVRYAADMRVQLVYADGTPFLSLPRPENGEEDSGVPDALFLRHLQSGRQENTFLEKPSASGPIRLLAVRTLRFPDLAPGAPLVVSVSRDLNALYAHWRRDALLLGGMLAALALFSSLVLVLFQKWQRENERKAVSAAAVLAERERFIRMITDNIPTQIAYWNAAMHCEYANNAYLNRFGKTADAMHTIALRELLGEKAFARREPFMRAALQGEPQLFERTLSKPDGSLRYSQVRYIPDRLDGEVRGFFVLAADVTELKITQKALEQRVHELDILATTDPLTGLANRRFFINKATEELTRSRRYKQPLAMLMIDVDHFKAVNDTHGHAAGDALLTALAATLRATMRTTDVIARLGGEEFGALLLQTDKETARTAADRLRQALGQACVRLGTETLCCTVSIGMAADTGGEVTSVDALLQRADLALYHAKENGRNQVCCHGEFEAAQSGSGVAAATLPETS